MDAIQLLIQSLKKVLADTYALSIKTRNYHWNVTGPHFLELHELFEKQHTDLAEAIDAIAERLRILGAKSPGSFADFALLTSISDGNSNKSAENMIEELAEDQKKLLFSLKDALKHAVEAQDEASEDLIIHRLRAHNNNNWTLSALLQQKPGIPSLRESKGI